jgi:uncharacterized heparinase superfamily protein
MAGRGGAGRGGRTLGNRLAIWRAGFGKPASGFVSQPEPRSIGLYARGKQLVAGNFLFAGHLVEAPGASIWDVVPPDAEFQREVQGFGWLDDLAAVADAPARKRAQDWTYGWIAAQDRGAKAGWTPDLTGRRLIRWINHAPFLLVGRPPEDSTAYFASATRQVRYLARRWSAALPGLPRFEALTGLIVAGLALEGMEALTRPALAALSGDCATEIDAQGGIPTRNPEELLDVFTLLNWTRLALTEAEVAVPAEISAAMERMAPTLRALRHADGGLARFHGGGRGLEGRLDTSLALSGVRGAPGPGLAMGFARLASGRTTVIVDCAAPPGGRAGSSAHASTLAFELTSGRRPLIVNCGSGAPFGTEWRRAGRATASHSTLALEGFSSSRFGRGTQDVLTDRAPLLGVTQAQDINGLHLSAAHGGWSETHGLTHGRVLTLDIQGRRLTGTDMLEARSPAEQRRLDPLIARGAGIPFALRFHLHPDVDAQLDLGGTAVSMALRSGEIWVFRHDGRLTLSLDSSVYLEKGRLQPRATRQIVLSGLVTGPQARIGWTLAKAQDTPLAIRDLDREDLPVPI